MKRFYANAISIIHVALLLLMISWIACDPAFELMWSRFAQGITTPLAAFQDAVAYVGWIRPTLLLMMVAATVSSFIWTFAAMLGRSSKQQRSLKAALALTTLAAVWCGLVINTSSLAWYGKRIRLAWKIQALEAIVRPLRTDWPDNDGELPGIGPYMAYPFGNPSTLILLQPPSVPSSEFLISAVDRGELGTIRLQLSGVHAGDWVEWHPSASRPQSFSGGLSDRYDLKSSVSLGSGWYLVRYDA